MVGVTIRRVPYFDEDFAKVAGKEKAVVGR